MSIELTCPCGKKFRVGDDKAGLKGRCPFCRQVIHIPESAEVSLELAPLDIKPPAAPATKTLLAPKIAAKQKADVSPFTIAPPRSIDAEAGFKEGISSPFKTPSRQRPITHGKTPILSVSRGWLFLAASAVLIPTALLAIKYGPVRVRHEWEAASQRGQADIPDVLTRAIQSYDANNGYWDIHSNHWIPEVKEFAFIEAPGLFRMADKVGFVGSSSDGKFSGFYYTRTGEIEADLNLHGTILKVTGRVKNGLIEAEISGKPATLPSLDITP